MTFSRADVVNNTAGFLAGKVILDIPVEETRKTRVTVSIGVCCRPAVGAVGPDN